MLDCTEEQEFLANRFMIANHISGSIIAYGDHGFEYQLWNGDCYYVPYSECGDVGEITKTFK